MDQNETKSNRQTIPVVEIECSIISKGIALYECLVIDVTEKGTNILSITLTGNENLDQVGTEAVLYQAALKYISLESKNDFFDKIEEVSGINSQADIKPTISHKMLHIESISKKVLNLANRGLIKSLVIL